MVEGGVVTEREIWEAGFWTGAYEFGAGGNEVEPEELDDLYMAFIQGSRETEGDFAR